MIVGVVLLVVVPKIKNDMRGEGEGQNWTSRGHERVARRPMALFLSWIPAVLSTAAAIYQSTHLTSLSIQSVATIKCTSFTVIPTLLRLDILISHYRRRFIALIKKYQGSRVSYHRHKKTKKDPY